MYRNFYSYNDMPRPIGAEENRKPSPPASAVHKNEGPVVPAVVENGKLFGKFELDDVILIVVAIILFAGECDDTLLLIAVGFIFLSGLE